MVGTALSTIRLLRLINRHSFVPSHTQTTAPVINRESVVETECSIHSVLAQSS